MGRFNYTCTLGVSRTLCMMPTADSPHPRVILGFCWLRNCPRTFRKTGCTPVTCTRGNIQLSCANIHCSRAFSLQRWSPFEISLTSACLLSKESKLFLRLRYRHTDSFISSTTRKGTVSGFIN